MKDITKTFYRSKECMLLHANEKVCNECIKVEEKNSISKKQINLTCK